MTKFLQEGDVIELKDGMTVYAEIPEKFVYSNKPNSTKPAVHKVIVGKIYKPVGTLEKIKKEIVLDFVKNLHNSLSVNVLPTEIEKFIDEKIIISDKNSFTLSPEKFVVYKTSYEGGSSGGGMNGHDSYPDGHRVFCESTTKPKIKVNFYQSGNFTAMIVYIKPIAKMSRVWKEEK